jgi:hypothetical protein
MSYQDLRKKYYTMKVWAYQYKIHDFPETLPSFTTKNPDEEMIKNDFKTLSSYYSHPAYIAFFPGYNGNIYIDNTSRKEG